VSFLLEVEGERVFGDESVLVGYGFEDEHLVVLGLIVVVVLVIYVDEEHVGVAIGSKSDAVEGGEGDPPFYFVFVLEVDELLDEGLDDVFGLEDVEDGAAC
jgi:hypothetical protein